MDDEEHTRTYITDPPSGFVVVAAISGEIAWALLGGAGYWQVRERALVYARGGSYIDLDNKVAVRLVNPGGDEEQAVSEGMSGYPWDLWVYNYDGTYLLVKPRG